MSSISDTVGWISDVAGKTDRVGLSVAIAPVVNPKTMAHATLIVTSPFLAPFIAFASLDTSVMSNPDATVAVRPSGSYTACSESTSKPVPGEYSSDLISLVFLRGPE